MDKDQIENDYYVNPEGVKLFRMIHHSATESLKAVVFLCHGLFEHCQAAYYEPVIKPLNNIGCIVITHDHMGHGLSDGAQGMIYHFELLVRDVLLDIDDVLRKKQIGPHIPVFIYGHSMGGLISVYATLKRPNFFKGMCLESPALIFPTRVSKMAIAFGKLMSFLFPTLSVEKMKYDNICRNMEYVNIIRHDKLRVHKGMSAKSAIEIYNSITSLKGLMENVNTPFFIGHGEADEICEIEGSKLLMRISPINDKILIPFPNAKHQLRMETENVASDFTEHIVEWISIKINN